MIGAAAVVVSVLLSGMAVFQLALVAGAPLGRLALGGQSEVLPTALRVGSEVSVSRTRRERLVMTPLVSVRAVSCLLMAPG